MMKRAGFKPVLFLGHPSGLAGFGARSAALILQVQIWLSVRMVSYLLCRLLLSPLRCVRPIKNAFKTQFNETASDTDCPL